MEAGSLIAPQKQEPIGSNMRRRESFLTVHREFYSRIASLDLLVPTYDSVSRKSTPVVAILNLVATVCGGGVLSLPLAFRRVGILPALLMLLISAIMTNFSLYILCSCARRTGGRTYGDVAKAAFGSLAQVITTLILCVLLVGILVAYMVLVQDIWTPIIVNLLQAVSAPAAAWLHKDGSSHDINDAASDTLLAGLIVVVSPFLLKRDLYALRHTCYVGFVSLILLTMGLTVRAYQRNVIVNPGLFSQSVKWWTKDIHDIIFAFPIVALSFLSSFNVLSVHGSLIRPTRDRVRLVLNGSVGICLFLFSMVGLGGYFCSYEDTRDNVFLDFDMSDNWLLLGRIGYGFTLLFAMPLVTLPCREALLSVPDQLLDWQHDSELLKEYGEASFDQVFNNVDKHKVGHYFTVNGVDFDAETLPLNKMTASQLGSPYGTMSRPIDLQGATRPPAMSVTSDEDLADATVSEYLGHILSTAAIVGFSYVAAVAVPGVATVWSIAGSSMAMIISFIIPAACYLKIRRNKHINPWSVASWALLVFSVVAAIVCTSQTVSDIFAASS